MIGKMAEARQKVFGSRWTVDIDDSGEGSREKSFETGVGDGGIARIV